MHVGFDHDMAETQSAGGRIDGRRARRDRNRVAVLDAVIELFSEENLDPGAHEVADRSGVSLRSVYRYFEDLDELIASAIDRQIERLRPLYEIHGMGEGPFDERVERFSTRRVELFEDARLVFRASSIRAVHDPQVRAQLATSRSQLAEQTLEMFGPELDALRAATDHRRARQAALTLDVLGQFETLERLRGDVGLSAAETTRFLRDGIGTALGR